MKFARRSFVSTVFALGAALTVAMPSFAPVSYTHLDVYKRQSRYAGYAGSGSG